MSSERRHRLKALSLLLPAGLLAGSALYLWGGAKLNFGTAELPGEGFQPIIFGVLLLGASLLLVVDTLVKSPVEEAPPQKKEIQSVIKIIGVWFGYVLALPLAGFSISTFLLVGTSSIIMGLRLRGAIILGLGVVVICFFLFILWLKVPLPSAAFLS